MATTEPTILDVKASELDTPEKVAIALNRVISVVRTLNENKPKTTTFKGIRVYTKASVDDTFPLPAFKLPPSFKPSAVRVANIRNITSPNATWTAAVDALYRVVGDGQLSVTYITGLTAQTEYLVDLEVSG